MRVRNGWLVRCGVWTLDRKGPNAGVGGRAEKIGLQWVTENYICTGVPLPLVKMQPHLYQVVASLDINVRSAHLYRSEPPPGTNVPSRGRVGAFSSPPGTNVKSTQEQITIELYGFAESAMLSAQAQFLSAHPVPRGNTWHSALGTAGPAKTSLP
jgi:hypothetical protein